MKKPMIQSQPLTGTRSCDCRYVFALMMIHLFVVTAIILSSLRGDPNGESTIAYRSPRLIETKGFLENSESGKINSAALQLEFLTHQGSSLVNHTCYDEGGSGPAWRKLEAVPVAEFCKGRRPAGPEFKYAAYTDIILAGRKLYFPASVNCSTIVTRGSKPLRTRFNPGRRSTPEVPVMVLPKIATLDDFRPQVSCHEMVFEVRTLVSVLLHQLAAVRPFHVQRRVFDLGGVRLRASVERRKECPSLCLRRQSGESEKRNLPAKTAGFRSPGIRPHVQHVLKPASEKPGQLAETVRQPPGLLLISHRGALRRSGPLQFCGPAGKMARVRHVCETAFSCIGNS